MTVGVGFLLGLRFVIYGVEENGWVRTVRRDLWFPNPLPDQAGSGWGTRMF